MNRAERLSGLLRFSCENCGKVLETTDDFDPVFVEETAPCCGATGYRTIWPTFASFESIDFAHSLDLDTDEGANTACVFVCAMLEALTRDALYGILERLKTPPRVSLALVGAARGWSDLLAIYRSLTGLSAAAALKSKGLEAWWKDWQELAQVRNGVGHGDWYAHRHDFGKGKPEPRPLHQLIDDVRKDALRAMMELRNAGLDALNVDTDGKPIVDPAPVAAELGEPT